MRFSFLRTTKPDQRPLPIESVSNIEPFLTPEARRIAISAIRHQASALETEISETQRHIEAGQAREQRAREEANHYQKIWIAEQAVLPEMLSRAAALRKSIKDLGG